MWLRLALAAHKRICLSIQSSPKLLKVGSMPRKGDPERWRKNEYAKERGSDGVKTKKIGDFGQYSAPEWLAETLARAVKALR